MHKILYTEGDSWTSGDIIAPELQKELNGFVNSPLNDDYRLPKVWPQKLGDRLGLLVLNTSVAGSSNDGIARRTYDNVLKLLKEYEPSEIMVVIGFTSPERKDFYFHKNNEHGWDTLYPLDKSEITEEREYFKKIYSSIYWNEEEYLSRYLSTVYNLHLFLNYHHVEHHFFNAFWQDNTGAFNSYTLSNSINLFKEKYSKNYIDNLSIENLLEEYPEIERNHFINTSFNRYIRYKKQNLFDGLHPSEEGHKQWSEFLYHFITKKSYKCSHDEVNTAIMDSVTDHMIELYKDVPEINELDSRGYPLVRPLFSHTALNHTFNIDTKSFEELSEGEHFYYFVQMHHNIELCAEHIRKLPRYVLRALKEGTCKLVMDDSLEGRNINNFLNILYKKLEAISFAREHIYYITNNLYAEKQHDLWKSNNQHITSHINVISYMYNVVDVQRLKNKVTHQNDGARLPAFLNIEKEIDYKKKNLPNIKTFLKVNRTGRPERNLFMLFVNKFNLYSKFKISFPSYNKDTFDGYVKDTYPDLLSEQNVKELKQKLPIDIDQTDSDNHGPPGVGEGNFNADLPFQIKHYRDTFFSVVFCAFPFDDACHLHSSTFNPIYCGHPVIQFGPKGHLKELRKRGFKTFSKWWDESYDNIDNGWKRFQAVLDIVKNLSTKTNEELLEMYIEMKNVLQHNSDLILNYDISNELTNRILYQVDENKALI